MTLLLLRILCNELAATDVVHITTATYPETADTLCGRKHVPFSEVWTEGHREIMPGYVTCQACRAHISWYDYRTT